MADQTDTNIPQQNRNEAIGLEELVRSMRGLARSTRSLGESTFEVAQREIGMAIRISEQLRDAVITESALQKARKSPLASVTRQDAHRLVDLIADTGTVLTQTVVEFVERFVDDPRPRDIKRPVNIEGAED